jgi:hypothetical protein
MEECSWRTRSHRGTSLPNTRRVAPRRGGFVARAAPCALRCPPHQDYNGAVVLAFNNEGALLACSLACRLTCSALLSSMPTGSSSLVPPTTGKRNLGIWAPRQGKFTAQIYVLANFDFSAATRSLPASFIAFDRASPWGSNCAASRASRAFASSSRYPLIRDLPRPADSGQTPSSSCSSVHIHKRDSQIL